MTRKPATMTESLIAFFPHYDNETLERFIRNNEKAIAGCLRSIAEYEHDTSVIRQELERRKLAEAALQHAREE